MTMTRAEHLQWCKDRANEYLDRGELAEGVTSMMSDLDKHPETADIPGSLLMFGMLAITSSDPEQARRFVNGFN